MLTQHLSLLSLARGLPCPPGPGCVAAASGLLEAGALGGASPASWWDKKQPDRSWSWPTWRDIA